MTAPRVAESSVAFPRTTNDWINLRDQLYTKVLIAEIETSRCIWVIVACLGLIGLLYILCLYRALYLKKYYFVKRDSFGRLCPHSCLLVSICGIFQATASLTDFSLRYADRNNPTTVFRFLLGFLSMWALYYLASVRTWSLWCAMPPTVFQLRDSKVSKWRRYGPLAIVMLLVLHSVLFIFTGIPMGRLTRRLENNWNTIRSRLQEITEQALTPEGIAPSPHNFKFESETLLTIIKFEKQGEDMAQMFRLFATGIAVLNPAIATMFSYASIVILRTLNIHLNLLNEARGRAIQLQRKGSGFSSESGNLVLSDVPQSLSNSVQNRFTALKQNLSWKALALFFSNERLDYSFLDTTIGEKSLLEQEEFIMAKASYLRRHWWRVFLQFIISLMCSLSYTTLAALVSVDFWKVGLGLSLAEVDWKIETWKVYTYITGPGIILAAITCVAEFLDTGKEDPEAKGTTPRPQSKEDEREGSCVYSTHKKTVIDGGNSIMRKICSYQM